VLEIGTSSCAGINAIALNGSSEGFYLSLDDELEYYRVGEMDIRNKPFAEWFMEWVDKVEQVCSQLTQSQLTAQNGSGSGCWNLLSIGRKKMLLKWAGWLRKSSAETLSLQNALVFCFTLVPKTAVICWERKPLKIYVNGWDGLLSIKGSAIIDFPTSLIQGKSSTKLRGIQL
jgi:hypothetical protein